MKKIMAVVVVAALLAVAPWGMGRLAETRLNHALESIQKNEPALKMVENRWTRGWFHSVQLVTFEIVLPHINPKGLAAAAPLPKSLRFSLRNEVLHGPLPGGSGLGLARVETKFVIGEQLRKQLIEVLGTDDPVQIVTRMGFPGSADIVVSGTGRTADLGKLLPQAQGTSVAWDDFNLSIRIGRHADSYETAGRQPRLEVRDGKDGHLLLGDIVLKGGGKRITGDIYDSASTFSIGRLSVASGGKPAVEIAAMQLVASTDRKGDFVDYIAKMGSGAVQSKYLDATGLQLKEVHYDLTLHHLHIATLQKLMDGLRQANATVAAGDADAGSALIGPLKEHGIELIKYDPELAIDRLGIVTSQGAGLLKGSIKFVGVTDADLSAGPMQLLQKLTADITIEVAQELADKIPNGAALTATAINQGFLKREDGKLVSRIEYRHGSLLVNGKAPQMPQNLQLPGMTPRAPPPPVKR